MTAVEQHQGNHSLTPAHIDHEAVLKSLNLNPRDPKTQALLLVCDRYGLDPLLKHAILIQGSLYVTRDGYLAVAHRSGQFDGIEVVDTGETPSHWTAKVSVYRKDMGRPFTYIGRYPKNGGNKGYGPEMAVKCAEVMALRRAFNVTGLPAADERWDDEVVYQQPQPASAPAAAIEAGGPPSNVDAETGEIHDAASKPTTTRRPPPQRSRFVAAILAQADKAGMTDTELSDLCALTVEKPPGEITDGGDATKVLDAIRDRGKQQTLTEPF